MRTSSERGMAVIVAVFMTLIVSALAAGMVHVARTEVLSSTSYTTMSQARYAAESGVASAANYLLSQAYEDVRPGTGSDPLANYALAVSPVLRSTGGTVWLSSDPRTASNYPLASVVTAFQAASSGTLPVGDGMVAYSARARLLAMRQITDGISGLDLTLQTWEITGIGTRNRNDSSGEVEVTAVIERPTRPVFSYAAFATGNGCSALSFEGNATTSSYDSSVPVPSGSEPTLTASDGHVGTNGNLGQTGNAQINGTLSTPMAGIGACTANNVTAATLGDESSVTGGLIQLPQPVEFPTPPPPDPMPPTTNQSISGMHCPSGYASVCSTGDGQTVFTPVNMDTPVLFGNLNLNGNTEVVLMPGTYIINSLSISGNSRIMTDPAATGPVRLILAGQDPSGAEVISVTGNGISNPSWDPQLLRIEYAGTKTIKMAGNGDTAAIIYAPNAHMAFSGNADFYGALVGRTMVSTGNTGIHYDRRLRTAAITAGNPVITTFTWQAF